MKKECESTIKFLEFYKFNNFTINKNDTLLKVLKDIDDNFTSIKSDLLTKCDCSELPSNITLIKLNENGSSVTLQVNANNSVAFKYSEGSIFTGNNNCSNFTGVIGSTFSISLNPGNSKFITIRVYDNNCQHYLDKTFTIVNNSTLPVPLPTLVSCNPTGRTFSLSSVVYSLSSQSITYQYDAENLVNAIAYIRNSGGTIIKTITGIVHTANTHTITLDTPLVAGNYTFDLVGTSCQGTASKTFTATDCALNITVNSITC